MRNVFIAQVNDVFVNRSWKDVVFFAGQIVKAEFDPMNISLGVSLLGNTPVRRWSDVARLINSSYRLRPPSSQAAAVHLHNELKLGDLLQLILRDVKKKGSHASSDLLAALDHGQPPVVVTNSVDENWGFFNSHQHTHNKVDQHD